MTASPEAVTRPVIALSFPASAEAYSYAYRADLVRLTGLAAAAVEATGGTAVVLDSAAEDADGRRRSLADAAGIDGALILGGGDVDPFLYGSDGHPSVVDADRGADDLEIALILGALALERPVFGVCRGLQLINVAFGGTLTEDLGPDSGHKDHSPGEAMVAHPVEIVPGSRLAGMLGAAADVMSGHHQGIDTLGERLVASAFAPDGLVEAIELPAGDDWLVAVQWHPEHEGTPEGQFAAVLEPFVAECRRRSERRAGVGSVPA